MIIPFHLFFPTILQWWGSDRAVQSQRYLPSSHCHLTSLPFNCNQLTLAVVCLSSTVIASPSHCNVTSTLPFNYPLILSWWFECDHSAVWRCQLYGKTTSVLQWKKPLWYGCQGFQILKSLTALKGRTANMAVKVRMMPLP